MRDGPGWFAAKRYGLGTGFPIAWQGWLLLGSYGVVVVAAGLLLDGKGLARSAVLVTATVVVMLVAAKTTRGGWRWRWGEGD